MPGPAPTPTALKLIRGNPGHRPLPKDEPQPSAQISLAPPDSISSGGAAYWRRLAPVLHRNGVLTEMDLLALEALCEQLARWRYLHDKVLETGILIKDPDTERPVRNPLLVPEDKAFKNMRSLFSSFGLTPADRARVAAWADNKEANPFHDFCNPKQSA